MSWKARRIAQAIFTIWAVMTLSFVLIRYMPGGPMDFVVGQLSAQHADLTQDEIYALAELYVNINPDAPLHVAYRDYMVAFLQLDLGQSVWYGRPVSEILGYALPWTILIMASALFVYFLIGVAMGGIMAYWEGSKTDISLSSLSTIVASIPFYITALVLLMLFAFRTSYFPAGGRYPSGIQPGLHTDFLFGVAHHATLPVLSMILAGFGGVALAMRGNSIQVLGEDFVRVARLRGLSDRRIGLRYVARNAILPLYTGLLIAIGSAFGGSVILEEIFVYPGVGFYMLQAVNARDYMLMMGAFTIITIAVVIALIIADLSYSLLDPRVENEGDREVF